MTDCLCTLLCVTDYKSMLLCPLAGNLRFNFHRHGLQIFFAGKAHRVFDFFGDRLGFAFINLNDNLIMNDVYDFC